MNNITDVERALSESLDARVFESATDLKCPSPPTSPRSEYITTSSSLPKQAKIYQKPNYERYISLADSKQLSQLNDAKSDSQITPHVPSKYAKTYELEKYSKNAMIIFNHCHFEDGEIRRGTTRDEKALTETFTEFGFTIETHRDLKKQELLRTLIKFSKTDFSKYGCICVAILTHGHRRPGYLQAYDQRYSENKIFQPFDASKNSTLAAKPIMFIIQACRGSEPSVMVGTMRLKSRLQLDYSDDSDGYHLPVSADRIIFHSSAVGAASIRDHQSGSWFIQTLCKNINKLADNYDLESIFTMVKREVALDYVTSKDWKQMPVVTSTLLREIYLIRKGEETSDKIRMDYKRLYIDSDDSIQHTESCKKTVSFIDSCESPDPSLTQFQPLHMPCSCFLEYFKYLEGCLKGFVQHNPEDSVARSLLKMMRRVGDGAEYNLQKFNLIGSVWEHFDVNMDKFPAESAKFVYRKYHQSLMYSNNTF